MFDSVRQTVFIALCCNAIKDETEVTKVKTVFVCFWKHQVRRFSEAYFFTEHPKEISLTFQEEL